MSDIIMVDMFGQSDVRFEVMGLPVKINQTHLFRSEKTAINFRFCAVAVIAKESVAVTEGKFLALVDSRTACSDKT